MKCKVVGYKPVKYTSKKTGKLVSGNEVYVLVDTPPESVVGGLVSIQWISSNVGYVPELNDHINILFNEYRSVEAVITVVE